ncbi:MAG: extracellular solute-binding protein, partial [Actinobacteria bacterium]|nr:extracellular solute-binding protein [Actinomycetota bacterium]
MGDNRLDRRDFLRLAAAGAVCAVAGSACSSSSGSKGQESARASDTSKAGATRKQLRIAQVGHFVPGYDTWFDQEYTQAWGDRNNVEVIVDHFPVAEHAGRAAAEVNARRGHDLFAVYGPPAAFEDDVVDLRDVIEEIESKVGKANMVAERTAFNPKTNKWFGVPDNWFPEVVNYRTDFWAEVGKGGRPDSWADLLSAGPKLKAAGRPLGIDMSQDLDGNLNLMALLGAYGASLQDEEGRPAINRPATVEAVKFATALWSGGQVPETLSWNDPSANNRLLAGGKGSLILNPISGLRAVEKQDPAMARAIGLAPPLAGPAARIAPGGPQVYVIWTFSENQELAKRFLVDLVLSYRDAFIHSEFYNFPAFPGSVPDLADLVAKAPGVEPAGKYALLAQSPDWSSNLGHPGYTNAAVDEVFNNYLIPKMFGAAARGEMTPEEAVKAADAQ